MPSGEVALRNAFPWGRWERVPERMRGRGVGGAMWGTGEAVSVQITRPIFFGTSFRGESVASAMQA